MKRFSDYLRQLIPQDDAVIDLLEEAAANLGTIPMLLQRLMECHSPEAIAALRAEIKVKEHIGDDLTHRIMERINMSFVTPIHRSDLLKLTSSMDDVLDLVDSMASKLVLYQFEGVDPTMVKFLKLISDSITEASLLIPEIFRQSPNKDSISARLERIHQIENEGDSLLMEAVGLLFRDSNISPKDLIRRERIYSFLETVTDAAEDLSNRAESIHAQER